MTHIVYLTEWPLKQGHTYFTNEATTGGEVDICTWIIREVIVHRFLHGGILWYDGMLRYNNISPRILLNPHSLNLKNRKVIIFCVEVLWLSWCTTKSARFCFIFQFLISCLSHFLILNPLWLQIQLLISFWDVVFFGLTGNLLHYYRKKG